MSSAVVSTSAAPGRPFLFDAECEAEVCSPSAESKRPGKYISPESLAESVFQSTIGNRQSAIPLTPASRLEIRPAPEMVTSGIPALDVLTGGLPRGCLTEICGPASSGRTSVMLAALASATRRGEYCAVIDASDALDPHSLAAAGIDLDRLLWVRCDENSPRRHRDTEKDLSQKKVSSRSTNQPERRLEQVLRATDLLLESGGFGLIILDLTDVPSLAARRIPLTTWFRFRRAVEHKPTILLAIEQQPIAGSCSSLLLQLGSIDARNQDSIEISTSDEPAAQRRKNAAHGASRRSDKEVMQAPQGQKTFCVAGEIPLDVSRPSHAQLFTELEIHAELIRSRIDRKPIRSVAFETKTAWAG